MLASVSGLRWRQRALRAISDADGRSDIYANARADQSALGDADSRAELYSDSHADRLALGCAKRGAQRQHGRCSEHHGQKDELPAS